MISTPGSGPDNGPNIGHVDDPLYRAIEARWRAEREAAAAQFQRAARYLLSLDKDARPAALDRYESQYDPIARLELGNYVAWRAAGGVGG